MAYSDFTLSEIIKIFGLTINETLDLFAVAEEIECSEYLAFNLQENIALAVAINT